MEVIEYLFTNCEYSAYAKVSLRSENSGDTYQKEAVAERNEAKVKIAEGKQGYYNRVYEYFETLLEEWKE